MTDWEKWAEAEISRLSCEGELAFRAGYGHGMNDAKHNYPPRPKGAYNEWRKVPVSEEREPCEHPGITRKWHCTECNTEITDTDKYRDSA